MKLRLRVTRALVLPAVLFALFTHHPYRSGSLPHLLLESAGFLLLMASTGGRIWAGVYLVGRKNRSLVSEGPFSLTRNPLYFFSFLGFIGAGLSFGSLSLAALFVLCFFGAHWPTITAEERRLGEIFQDSYRAYQAEVPRFLPALRGPRLGRVMELEAPGFLKAIAEALAIPFVFPLAALVEWGKLTGLLPVLFRMP